MLGSRHPSVQKGALVSTTRQLLAGHGIRCTPQRRALYEALRGTKSHPTAEELYRIVKPATERLSRATVYNTLEMLCEVGLARKLPSSRGCCRYDADVSEHLHICFREDGAIRDLPDDLGEKLIRHISEDVIAEIEDRLGIGIDGISVQLMARRRNA
ncbi:MAG: transcriptional repressor [Planctomycetota bacterium]|nr:MAG: transcriptional repressor [Planctomycetota bacterium]